MLIDFAKTHVTKALKIVVLGYRNHRGKSAIRLLRGATDTQTIKIGNQTTSLRSAGNN